MSITDIHTTRESYRELVEEYEKLRAKYSRLRKAVEFVVDELSNDFDTVDGDDGQPRPNKAMQLAVELDEGLFGPGGFR